MAITDEQLRRYALGEMPIGEAIDLSYHVAAMSTYQTRVRELIAAIDDEMMRSKSERIQNELSAIGSAIHRAVSSAVGPDAG